MLIAKCNCRFQLQKENTQLKTGLAVFAGCQIYDYIPRVLNWNWNIWSSGHICCFGYKISENIELEMLLQFPINMEMVRIE